jgi:hypothetical protein
VRDVRDVREHEAFLVHLILAVFALLAANRPVWIRIRAMYPDG